MTMNQNLTELQTQLHQAAAAFATDAHPLSELLTTMVNDVARAMAEPLEIFPVCHHSPASALHLIARLQQSPPKVIYIELCEDLQAVVPYLLDCKLPVALQAFASESPTFPADWTPLSVVAPLTEASAEYQAIAYTLQHPETELVFVDRAVDFVFQWKKEDAPETPADSNEEANLHGGAIGVEIGSLVPTFDQFLTFLLQNAKVRHFAEWWDQYVEQLLIGTDYATYRQVMYLMGSLIRRLGRRAEDVAVDRLREQSMWTRIKQHLAAHQINPREAMFICGAAHTVNEVAEFGVESEILWDIPPRTATPWLYGLLPSSFLAIEHQFGHPPGTVSLAEKTWKKSLQVNKLKPFTLSKDQKAAPKKKTSSPPKGVTATNDATLHHFLTRPPQLVAADVEQLLQWCADIVALARQNGYLASTADSIAIYQTAMLLANLRHRPHPSPYDFQDAAITCLEKDYTPKKRNIAQLCQILLGGDRIGSVGYSSLPPLVQNIYDRLAPLKLNLESRTNQRALMDFKSQPELLPCSDLLWRLHYVLGQHAVQPIMGERALNHAKPVQESWEIRLGKYQGALINLGYEAITLEQLLEQRLKKAAMATEATTKRVLGITIDSILYLNKPRLTQELGQQAIKLLPNESGGADAPVIFKQARELVGYYRATPDGLPTWLGEFVSVGYSHYATLLPQAFVDQGSSPEQLAGMLGFIFTFESLALALGCSRSQLVIALKQVETTDPAKIGLLWTAEWLLKLRTLTEMRDFFHHMVSNPMLISTLPAYLDGFVLALTFTPRLTRFVVELLSEIFSHVPDEVLFPWLPSLIMRLRPHADILLPLIKEASAVYPASLSGFMTWQPAWLSDAPTTSVTDSVTLTEKETQVQQLIQRYPATWQWFSS